MKSKIYSVYLMRDPRDNEVRYLGMSNNVKTRIKQHVMNGQAGLTDSTRDSELSFRRWLSELHSVGTEPLVDIVLETHDKGLASFVERSFQSFHAKTVFNPRISSLPQLGDAHPALIAGALAFASEELRSTGVGLRNISKSKTKRSAEELRDWADSYGRWAGEARLALAAAITSRPQRLEAQQD